MSAKTRRSSPARKGDAKTTVIVILSIIVLIQGLALWNNFKKDQSPEAPPKKIEQPKVIVPKPAVVVKPRPKSVAVVERAEPVVPAAVVPVKKAPPGSAGKIAFILDDWGYTTRNCKYLHSIRAPLAIAILPNLRHTEAIAQCVKESGKDAMLHLPLQPYHNNDKYPDNYLITTDMKPSLVIKLLEDTLKKMPYVAGVNNHMGSKATEDKPLMKLIFKQLRKHGLFFVDSMTSPHRSVCAETAQEIKLPFAQRDVFLDNVNVKEAIQKQMDELAQKARKKGYAIAIGHDRQLTMQVLQEQIPILEAQGFEVVSIKELLKNK